jgi:hypothetical protein
MNMLESDPFHWGSLSGKSWPMSGMHSAPRIASTTLRACARQAAAGACARGGAARAHCDSNGAYALEWPGFQFAWLAGIAAGVSGALPTHGVRGTVTGAAAGGSQHLAADACVSTHNSANDTIMSKLFESCCGSWSHHICTRLGAAAHYEHIQLTRATVSYRL